MLLTQANMQLKVALPLQDMWKVPSYQRNFMCVFSAQTETGANISDQWTGSELPLAFASDSNPSDSVDQCQ